MEERRKQQEYAVALDRQMQEKRKAEQVSFSRATLATLAMILTIARFARRSSLIAAGEDRLEVRE